MSVTLGLHMQLEPPAECGMKKVDIKVIEKGETKLVLHKVLLFQDKYNSLLICFLLGPN